MTRDSSSQEHRIGMVSEGPNRWLDVQILSRIAPLEGMGLLTLGQFVPEALEGTLFDGTTKVPTSRKTFAILDAATYSFLPDILETSGLRHKCLFIGNARDENADAAPWLVELETDHSFTRNLMSSKDCPGGLWEYELGIFLKTSLSFDDIWGHCRKFTRIQDEDSKWLYYRFWSPPISTRIMCLGNRPELVQLVSPFFPASDVDFEVYLLNSDLHARLSRVPETAPPRARPILTKAAHQTIKQVRRVQQYEELIAIILKHVSGKTDQNAEELQSLLRLNREKFFGYGFWQRDHLAKLMAWEALLGPDFVETYANGTVRSIIMLAQAPYEAIMNIEFFLEAQEVRRIEAEQVTHGE